MGPTNLALSIDSNIRRYASQSTPLLESNDFDLLIQCRSNYHQGQVSRWVPRMVRSPFTRYLAVSYSPQHRFYCQGDGEPVGPGENALPSPSLPFSTDTFCRTRSPWLDTLVHISCSPRWALKYRLLARHFTVHPRR